MGDIETDILSTVQVGATEVNPGKRETKRQLGKEQPGQTTCMADAYSSFPVLNLSAPPQ